MEDRAGLWREVISLAERLLQLVRSAVPREQLQMPGAHAYILGFFSRSQRLYDGVLVLLKAKLPEEAAFLGRSLFEDSLHLRQLAAEPQNRDALILRWANDSIEQKRGLMKVAKQIGLDPDISEVLSRLDKERQHLQEYARRHNVRRFRSFQSVREGAFRFGRQHDYWTYAWAHESVHGTDAAWLFSRHRLAEKTVALHAKTDDPVLRASLAQFSARSMVDAAEATFAIFGWPPPPELRQTLTHIDRAV